MFFGLRLISCETNNNKKMKTTIEIRICLGSSCFARGNDRVLEIMKAYIEEHQLKAEIDFRGHLCAGDCINGPVIAIAGKAYYHVNPDMIESLLDSHFSILKA